MAWIAGPIFGQVNVEKFREEPNAHISASFSLSETRTTKTNRQSVNLLFNRIFEKHEVLAVGGLGFGEQNSEDFQKNSFLHLRYFYKIGSWGPEAFGQDQQNRFSNLRERNVYGVGLRKIFKGETHHFRGGISLMKERLRLESFEDTISTDRLNHYLSYVHKYFATTLYYQPNLKNFRDKNLTFDGLISLSLIKEKLMLDFFLGYTENSTRDIKDRFFRQTLRFNF